MLPQSVVLVMAPIAEKRGRAALSRQYAGG
jgi:hypothetical protein